MTSPAAAMLYLAQHNLEHEGKRDAIYNPKGLPVEELPWIYGFNNGGSPGWYSAQLISQDGHWLGSHCCSHEGYMPADLGVLADTRPDRHEEFQKHYPDGYRMIFVPYHLVRENEGLVAAVAMANKRSMEAFEGAQS
jgi:hypothetical protein